MNEDLDALITRAVEFKTTDTFIGAGPLSKAIIEAKIQQARNALISKDADMISLAYNELKRYVQ